MPGWFWYYVVFAYGAIVGSFLNVLIYRMPLGISVATPPSRCPRCRTQLGFWDNIPLLSFLALGGRCRYCRTPISWRYFTVELLSAALWVALFHTISGIAGITWVDFVAHALFGSILIAVIFIDLDHFIIPDELNWAGTTIGFLRDLVCLAYARYAGAWDWKEFAPDYLLFGWLPKSLAGSVLYGGLLFLISFGAFIYYAREEGETVMQTARRFFVFEEEPETQAAEVDTKPRANPAPAPAATEEEVEEEEAEPARLRFSPGFTALLAALLLTPILGFGAIAVVALPLAGFLIYSREAGESFAAAAIRFFASAQEPEMAPMPAREDDGTELSPADGEAAAGDGSEPSAAAEADPSLLLAEEADRFALEAETGKFGGMGLGDVKLAIAIGALLGPGLALLSLLFATAVGAVTGIALAAIHGKGLRIGVPFGPFMAFGAIAAMLYGEPLVQWYLRFVGLA